MNDYKGAIEKNGVISFTPGGISMWPIISNRADTVIIEAPKGTLKKYDVAFYQRENGQNVLHRVVKVYEHTYDMLGDSQVCVEHGVPHEAVFGIMTGYYKKGKFIDCQKNVFYRLVVRVWTVSVFARRVVLKILRMCGIKAK